MRMTFLWATLCASLAIGCAPNQDTSAESTLRPVAQAPAKVQPLETGRKKSKKRSIEDDIRKMLELTGSSKLAAQMVEPMLQAFEKTQPGVPKKFWDEMRQEIASDELTELIVPIYAKHFTHAEIKELIRFYESPVGKKVNRTMPTIMTESQAAGQKWGIKIARRIQARLKKEGHMK